MTRSTSSNLSEGEEKLKKIINKLGKRARLVVELILKQGYVTTEDLQKRGYEHPPRAVRDVRESGIPIETFYVTSPETGRRIAAYKLGDLTLLRNKLGRKVIPKRIKIELYKNSGGRCFICYGRFAPQYLQVDHRIPYEITGGIENLKGDIKNYMLLCSSCNRAKSWTCEHCTNWLKDKSVDKCSNCYWANPENYCHIALNEVRRVDLLWGSEEIHLFERLKDLAQKNGCSVSEYVKRIVKEYVERAT